MTIKSCPKCGSEQISKHHSGWCECKYTFFFAGIKKILPDPARPQPPHYTIPKVEYPRDEYAFLNRFRKDNPDWNH